MAPMPARMVLLIALLAALVGCGGSAGISNITGSTDPTSGFVSTGSMAVARQDAAAVRLADGKVLVLGGWDGTLRHASVERYDPDAGSFSPAGTLKVARYGATATLLNTGKLLVTGGQDASDLRLASAELFDPATGSSTLVGTGMAQARVYHTATLLNDGRVLIVGGTSATAPAELYDPLTNSFATLTATSFDRRNHTATLLNDGRVLIAGGDGNAGVLVSTFIFSPFTSSFAAGPDLNLPHTGHTATLTGSGSVLLVGGWTSTSATPSSVAELFDPALNNIRLTGASQKARGYAVAAALPGKVLLAGGYGPLGDAETYTVSSGIFSVAGNLQVARSRPIATPLANGRILILGGATPAGATKTAELYLP